MKKILFIFLLISVYYFQGSAQHVCGTHSPTAAEHAYILSNVLTQPILKNSGTTCIPIQIHIVRETNGIRGE